MLAHMRACPLGGALVYLRLRIELKAKMNPDDRLLGTGAN